MLHALHRAGTLLEIPFMRAVLIATGALLLAGCAGQPTEKQAAPAATTAANTVPTPAVATA